MQENFKILFRNLETELKQAISKKQSVIIFGPRQVGKTTLIKNILKNIQNPFNCFLQDPKIRIEYEKDPSLLIRQIKAIKEPTLVFVDEAQKVPELFDSIQYLIDERLAYFIITGSSARKLRRKNANLLPGRTKTFKLTPFTFNEIGCVGEKSYIFNTKNINPKIENYTLEKIMLFGLLPPIVILEDDKDKADFLKSYVYTYLEEEIRAELIIRKMGPFINFLELFAIESGSSPNFSKLSMDTGVSVPTIKEFFNILEDTLIVEKIEPYLKNQRRRIISSPKYYFFDIGVRNTLARMPLLIESIYQNKGKIFENLIISEIANRIKSLNLDWKLYYWRTSTGVEVDCIIDKGNELIPIEIKSSSRIEKHDAYGIIAFMKDYPNLVNKGYIINTSDKPEFVTEKITAIPWNCI